VDERPDERAVVDMMKTQHVDLSRDVVRWSLQDGNVFTDDHQSSTESCQWRPLVSLDQRQHVSTNCCGLSGQSDHHDTAHKSPMDRVKHSDDRHLREDTASAANHSEQTIIKVTTLNDLVVASCEPTSNFSKVDLPVALI